MLRCFFVKSKLYPYLEETLSDTDKSSVRNHLDSCTSCRNRASQLKTILDLVRQKRLPELPREFWHNFRADLDNRLNQELVPGVAAGCLLKYRLRPAFAYAFALILVAFMGFYFHFQPFHYDDLVNEVTVLEEIGVAPELNQDKDVYIDELNLLYQFDQNLS